VCRLTILDRMMSFSEICEILTFFYRHYLYVRITLGGQFSRTSIGVCMNVFCSWSKEISRTAALKFSRAFEEVNISAFVSTDIAGGRHWRDVIFDELKSTDELLMFLSPENLNSQWLFYEAGAAEMAGANITPIWLGVTENDAVLPGPLAHRQAIFPKKKVIRELLCDMQMRNKDGGVESFSESDSFEKFWTLAQAGVGQARSLVKKLESQKHVQELERAIRIINSGLKQGAPEKRDVQP